MRKLFTTQYLADRIIFLAYLIYHKMNEKHPEAVSRHPDAYLSGFSVKKNRFWMQFHFNEHAGELPGLLTLDNYTLDVTRSTWKKIIHIGGWKNTGTYFEARDKWEEKEATVSRKELLLILKALNALAEEI